MSSLLVQVEAVVEQTEAHWTLELPETVGV
jgi:hypothetical protein